jgi:hypothetical protein
MIDGGEIAAGEPYCFFWKLPRQRPKFTSLEEGANVPPVLPIGLIHIGRVESPSGDDPDALAVPHQALCGFKRSPDRWLAQRTHPFGVGRECPDCRRIYASLSGSTVPPYPALLGSAKAGLAFGCAGGCSGLLLASFIALASFAAGDALFMSGRSASPVEVERFQVLEKVLINVLVFSALGAVGALMALKVARVAAALMLFAALDFLAAGTLLAIYGASSGWNASGLSIWHFITGGMMLGGSLLAFVARAGSRLAHPSTTKS